MKCIRLLVLVCFVAVPVASSAPRSLFHGTARTDKVAESSARPIDRKIVAAREPVTFLSQSLHRQAFRVRFRNRQFSARVSHRLHRTVDGEQLTTLRGRLFKGKAPRGAFTLSYTGTGTKPASIFGEFSVQNLGLFALQTSKPGNTVLERHNQDEGVPGCGEKDHGAPLPPGAKGTRKIELDPNSAPVAAALANDMTLTVLVAFSPQAAAYLGSSTSSSALTAVDQLTQAFQNSNIPAQAQLVHTMTLSGGESGNFDTDLRSITNFDGKWDEVHAARNQYGADMVALIIQNTQYCGLGWLGGYPGMSLADYSFSATSSYCIVQHTVSHEIGHNLGANHDRAYASNGAFPDGFGLIFRGNSGRLFGDVMTYAQYSNATRIPYFSSPNIFYDGVAIGKLNTENNARVVSYLLPQAVSNRGPAVTPSPTPTPGSYAVSGTFAASGTGVSGARVILTNASGDVVAVTTTGPQGEYSFQNVRGSQTYYVSVSASGYDSSSTAIAVNGDTTVPVQGTLKNISITALVIDGLSQNPIANAQIVLEGAASGPKSAITNAQGKATIDVPYGTEYRLSAQNDAFIFKETTLRGVAKGSTTRVFSALP